MREAKNPWKRATFILAIFCTASIIGNFYQILLEEKVEINEVCDEIRATPAWVDSSGMILFYGLVEPIDASKLIDDETYLLYHPKCGACKKQIEAFGDSWEEYVKEGLAIDCSK